MVWTLRQPRYATLAAIMLVLALGCIAAGTFELHRFHEKRHDNGTLRANYHSAAVPLTTALVPVTAAGKAPGVLAIRYCTVTARGVFDPGGEQFLDDQSQGGHQGFLVLTPLRTPSGVLLVARGFVASTANGSRPTDVPAAPTGTVTVRGRLQTASQSDDHAGRLPRQEITAVNPTRQASRLDAPVFQAYVTLAAGGAGTTGLGPLPAPDLSNPTGGAGELQLLSYVVQWYVFALLAVIAPFVFARADAKEARRRFLGLDDDDVEFDLAARAPELRAVTAGSGATALSGSPDLSPAVRERAELARAGADAQWQHAERLADRYGRSLGPRPDADRSLRRERPLVEPSAPDSSVAPHRSGDDYHGTYNDYLWSLAMADGNIPEVLEPIEPIEPLGPPATSSQPPSDATETGGTDHTWRPPRVIDATPTDTDGADPFADRDGGDERDR